MSGPDLADLIAYARARGGKVILAGDTSQLQAVENGGGMSLLAAALGHDRPGAPLFPSERKAADGSASRATAEVFRSSLAHAAELHLPAWAGRLTPHVLRHYCASQLYRGGLSLFAIQELLGHAWTGTTARYVNPRELHQPGEKPQVSRPRPGRNSVPRLRTAAV